MIDHNFYHVYLFIYEYSCLSENMHSYKRKNHFVFLACLFPTMFKNNKRAFIVSNL